MQSDRSDSSGPITQRLNSLPSATDTRGKHRIQAELKRLEQEVRFLEVISFYFISLCLSFCFCLIAREYFIWAIEILIGYLIRMRKANEFLNFLLALTSNISDFQCWTLLAMNWNVILLPIFLRDWWKLGVV